MIQVNSTTKTKGEEAWKSTLRSLVPILGYILLDTIQSNKILTWSDFFSFKTFSSVLGAMVTRGVFALIFPTSSVVNTTTVQSSVGEIDGKSAENPVHPSEVVHPGPGD